MDDHQAVFDLHALHTQPHGLPPQADHIEQLGSGPGQRTEAVDHLGLETLEHLLVAGRIQLPVQAQFLGGLLHVGVGQLGLDVDLDHAIRNIAHLIDHALLGTAHAGHLESLRAEFGDRLLHDLLVGFETDVGDKAALLGAQQIAGAPNVEILHGAIDSRTQI